MASPAVNPEMASSPTTINGSLSYVPSHKLNLLASHLAALQSTSHLLTYSPPCPDASKKLHKPHIFLPSILSCFLETYIMIKPDGVQRGLVGEIISRFEKKGFKLKGLKLFKCPEELAQHRFSSFSKMKIEIVSSELIEPSSPTPSESRDFKLSMFDERIPPSYIPLVLYYSCNESTNIKQPGILECLKKSLSDALVQFYPLAGRMDGQISVNCNDKGALYLEAKVDGKISDIIEFPEVELLDKLIPYQSKGSITNAEELIAIQVSLFSCGGISIGICISHRIADGWTLCSFIKGWSSMACTKCGIVPPVFNSSSLFPPQNTPDFKLNIKNLAIQPPVIHLVTKRFVFNESVINALKLQVINNSSIINPTRVEVVSAFLWKACIVARRIEKSGKSVAFHPVNLRGRVPALTDDSFGNIFQMTSAVNSDETDWIHLAEKWRAAFRKISSDYINELLGENGFELVRNNFIQINKLLGQGDCEIFRFNSFCRFPLYETDFGWGKPNWVSASFSNRNSIFMLDSKSSSGIEAWIVMTEDDVKKLEQEISIELQAFV